MATWDPTKQLLTSDEGVDAKPVHEVVIPFLRGSKQLSHNVEVRVHLASSVQQSLSNIDGSVVAVIDTQTVKQPGHQLRVALHILPQEGGVRGTVTIAELDGITPHYQLPLEIYLGEGRGGEGRGGEGRGGEGRGGEGRGGEGRGGEGRGGEGRGGEGRGGEERGGEGRGGEGKGEGRGKGRGGERGGEGRGEDRRGGDGREELLSGQKKFTITYCSALRCKVDQRVSIHDPTIVC